MYVLSVTIDPFCVQVAANMDMSMTCLPTGSTAIHMQPAAARLEAAEVSAELKQILLLLHLSLHASPIE